MSDDMPASVAQEPTQENDTSNEAPQAAAVPVAGIGALGAGLIGGAVAAVIGIAIVGPLLRRRKTKRDAKPATLRRPRRRSEPAGDA